MNNEFTKNTLLNELIEKHYAVYSKVSQLEDEISELTDAMEAVEAVIDKILREQMWKEFQLIAEQFGKVFNSGRWPNIKKNICQDTEKEGAFYNLEKDPSNSVPQLLIKFKLGDRVMCIDLFFYNLSCHLGGDTVVYDQSVPEIMVYHEGFLKNIQVDEAWMDSVYEIVGGKMDKEYGVVSKSIDSGTPLEELYRVLDEFDAKLF